MSANIQIGKSGQDDTSGIEPQEGVVNMPQRVSDLEKRADDVKNDFQKLERDIERFKTLAYFVIGAMAVAFTFTSVFIGFDYLKNNQDRYEKFADKIEGMKEDFYTKEQVETNISSSANQINQHLNDFKKCLKEGGWNRCF